MHKKEIIDYFGWGIGLWFLGYLLGIVLWDTVPPHLIGWTIMPIGTSVMLWVLIKKIASPKVTHFVKVGLWWSVIAVIFDYLFLVRIFQPEDGYYKLSVFIYYLLTLSLPIVIGILKTQRRTKQSSL